MSRRVFITMSLIITYVKYNYAAEDMKTSYLISYDEDFS